MYKDNKIFFTGLFEYSQSELEFMREETYHTQGEFREAACEQLRHDIWEYLRANEVDEIFQISWKKVADVEGV